MSASRLRCVRSGRQGARRAKQVGQCASARRTLPLVKSNTPRAPGALGRHLVKGLRAGKLVASTSPYANVYVCARPSAGIFNTPAEVDQALAARRHSLAQGPPDDALPGSARFAAGTRPAAVRGSAPSWRARR